MADFGPADQSPWWVQRKMATGNIWVASALAVGCLTVTFGLGYFAVMSLAMGFYPKAVLILLPMWLIMTVVVVIAAWVKGITVEDRREAIVWYPSWSFPVATTRRARIGYGIVALVLAGALIQQAYNASNSDIDVPTMLIIGTGLLASIIHIRPVRPSSHIQGSTGEEPEMEIEPSPEEGKS